MEATHTFKPIFISSLQRSHFTKVYTHPAELESDQS